MAAHSDSLLLTASGLTKSFRGVHALQDYRLELFRGDLLGVIGPNGAGKTTLFNLLTGIVKPTHGQISFQGASISGMRPEAIARLGIARTFQKIRLFTVLTAIQNVRVAKQARENVSLWEALLSLPSFGRKERELSRQALHLLEQVGIGDAAHQTVSRLTYNQQRRLELACALALSPQLLLLDEPTAGMNPTETEKLIQLVLSLQQEYNLTIVLIEHNMQVIMNTCQRIQALNYGEIIGEGTPQETRRNPAVVEAYLGHAHVDEAKLPGQALDAPGRENS